MTLVATNEGNPLPIMLTVQQQQHHHHHHHLHHGSTGASAQTHRGNVIVSTGGVTSNEMKIQQQHSCKRTKVYGQTGQPYGTVVPHQPASVARRNARERNRVKQVNNGFATLRQHIPQSVAQALGGNTAGTHGGSRVGSKKLSKVETLRMAVEYIRSLQRLLEEHDTGSDVSSSSTSTTSVNTSSTTSTCNGGVNLDNERRSTTIESRLHRHQHLRQNPSPTFLSAPCSEASSSPTPSFVSETSSAGSQGYGNSTTVYNNHSDAYDNYEPMSPEDEELLDVISWWQQSQ